MSDIALHFDNTFKEYDINVIDGDLERCDGLESAVIISLFSWARADASEIDPGTPQYGWWGDKIDEDGSNQLGSKLYLLKRAKITEETIAKAEDYIKQALQWMIEDKVASDISVNLERNSKDLNRVDGIVTITRGNDTKNLRFNDLWAMM